MKRLSTLAIALLVFVSAQAQERAEVAEIVIDGNTSTKEYVILRELEVNIGDTLLFSELEYAIQKSRENLLNKGIFNFVDCEYAVSDKHGEVGKINIKITVTERWNIWPTPKLDFADRNFNAWWQNKDFSRLSGGIDLIHYNFLGRLYKVTLTCIAGYNQDFGAGFETPNIGNSKWGAGFSAGYRRNIGIAYATIGDTVQHFVDEDGFAHRSYYTSLSLSYRQTLRDTYTLSVGYDSRHFADSLGILNPDFISTSGKPVRYLTATFKYRHDYRNDRNYPLSGNYLEIEATNTGFLKDSPNFAYVKTTFDFFAPLDGRFFWASNITFRRSFTSQPAHYLCQGIGYGEDMVRGFELYAVDGKDFYLTKHNLKFALIPYYKDEIDKLKDTRFSKFHIELYANLFFDAAYVPTSQLSLNSRMQNKLIFGTGLGLDFVTYYDKVVRIEYGLNNFGESRISLHFTAPI